MPNPPSVPVLFSGSDTGSSNSDGITNALAQIWNGTGGEPGATVTLSSSVDGQAGTGIVAGDGSWTVVTELTEATHQITATQTDLAGDTSSASGAAQITIDRTKLETPTMPDLADYVDTGSSNSDNITIETALDVLGSVPTSTVSVELTITNTGTNTQTTVNVVPSAGSWIVSLDPLSPGNYDVVQRVTDAAGNVSDPSPALNIWIDTEAPVLVVPATITVNNDPGQAGAIVTFTPQATDNVGLDNVSASPEPGEFFPLGNNQVFVSAIDLAGNTAEDFFDVIVADNENPVVVTQDVVVQLDNTGMATITPELVNGGTSDNSGSFTLSLDQMVFGSGDIGNQTVTLTATDEFGNTDQATATVTVFNNPQPPVNLSVSTGAGSEAGQTVITVTATAATPVSGNQTVDLTVTGTNITAGDFTLSNSQITIADGQTTGTVTFTVTDDALDEVATETATLTISNPSAGIFLGPTTTQTITIDDNEFATPTIDSLVTDTGASNSDFITSSTVFSLSGTAEAGASVALLSSGTSFASTTADVNGNWSVSGVNLGIGAFSVSVRAEDTAGNTAESPVQQVVVDTAINPPSTPDLVAASDSGGSNTDNITTDRTPTFTGTTEPGATVVLFADNALVGAGTADSSGIYTITTTPLDLGTVSITADAVDLAGNNSTRSAAQQIEILGPATADAFTIDFTGLAGILLTGSTEFGEYTLTVDRGRLVSVDPFIVGINAADIDPDPAVLDEALFEQGNWSFTLTRTDGNVFDLDGFDIITGLVGTSSGNLIEVEARDANSIVRALLPTTGISNDEPANFDLFGIDRASFQDIVQLEFSTTLGPNFSFLGVDNIVLSSIPVQTPPTVIRIVGQSPAELTTDADVLVYRVFFREDVSGVSADDFTVTGGTTAGVTQITPVNASIYDVTISGGDLANFDGTVGLSLIDDDSITSQITQFALGGAGAGNGNAAAALPYTVGNIVTPTIDSVTDDTGRSNTDFITNDTLFTLSGTAEANSQVVLFIGPTSIASATADVSGNWAIAGIGTAFGAFNFNVVSTDAAGNAASSAVQLVVIDPFMPDPPSTPELAPQSDTGRSTTDNITSDDSPTFTGTAEIESRVAILAGGVEVGSALVDSSGNYSITTSQLAPGEQQITATATDIAGNTSSASAVLVLTIDKQAPDAPSVPDLVAFSDLGLSNNDNLTSDTTPTFTGTAEAGSTVSLIANTLILGSGVADLSGNYSITSLALSEGDFSIQASATDIAGNSSAASGALSLELDTTSEIPVILGVDTSDGTLSSGATTSDQTISISGSAEEFATVEIFIDGLSIATTQADLLGNWTLDYTSTVLPNGTIAITAQQTTDAAGNAPSELSQPFALTVLATDAEDDSFRTDEDTAISGDVLANNGNGADANAVIGNPLDVVALNGDPTLVGSQFTLASGAFVTLNSDGTFDYDPNGSFEALAVGATDTDSFTYTIEDANGGRDSATVTITIDGANDAPVALDDTANTEAGATINVDVLNNDNDIDGDTLQVQNPAAQNGQVTVNADNTIAYTPNTGFSGTDTFTYVVSDGNGGINSATVTVAVTPTINVITGRDGPDRLVGTPGLDRIEALAGNDAAFGRGSNDTILGAQGNDRLFGDEGDDSLVGGENNDRLFGNAGADRLIGGEGNDFLFVDQHDIDAGLVDGGAGIDEIGADGTIVGLNMESAAAERFIGSEGNDVVTAGAGSVVLRGRGGNDTLSGGTGDDVLFGDGGDDSLTGGEGRDRLSGNAGTDRLIGGEGDDTLRIDQDDIAGGLIDAGSGRDLILADGTIVGLDMGSVGAERLNGGAGDDVVSAGSSVNVVLNGRGGNDTLSGGTGNDRLTGGGGNDSLAGGTGNDTLVGDGGNDTLLGGLGNDRLIGSTGADVFLYDTVSSGNDVVRGFELGDVLRFEASLGLTDTDFVATASGSGAVVTGAGTSITLVAIDPTELMIGLNATSGDLEITL